MQCPNTAILHLLSKCSNATDALQLGEGRGESMACPCVPSPGSRHMKPEDTRLFLRMISLDALNTFRTVSLSVAHVTWW